MVAELSKASGLKLETSDNLFESMQSMADMADFSSSLRTLAITLTRIANDIRLLASGPNTGLNEISLPPVQPGSSIMPGKVNPVMAEMLNMAMIHIMGNDHAIALASQAGQLELNVMMPIIAHNLFEMMQVATGSITAFTNKCVHGITANPETALEWLERNPIIVTALTPMIGYKSGAELVEYARSNKVTVREAAHVFLMEGKLFHQIDGRKLTVQEVENALSSYFRMADGGIL
jgi:fumarate hydratase class II